MKWLIGTKIQAKIDQEMICSSPNLYLSPSWNPNQGTYLLGASMHAFKTHKYLSWHVQTISITIYCWYTYIE